jgi:hypothetical protein
MPLDEGSKIDPGRGKANNSPENTQRSVNVGQAGPPTRQEQAHEVEKANLGRDSSKKVQKTDGIDNSDLKALLALAIQKASDKK